MQKIILLLVLVGACLVQAEEPPPKPEGRVATGRSSTIFFSIVKSSSMAQNIMLLNTSVNALQTQLNRLTAIGYNDELRSAASVLKRYANAGINMGFRLTYELSEMTSDTTIPTINLFDQFQATYARLAKFAEDNYAMILDQVRDNIGCTIAREIDITAQNISRQAQNMEQIVSSLDRVMMSSGSTGDSSIVIINLVNALASSVLQLQGSVDRLGALTASMVTGWQTANNFLLQLYLTYNSTYTSMNSSINGVQTTLAAQRTVALGNYYGTQLSMKTQISQAISSYSIFVSSKQLFSLAQKFDHSYLHLYHFLRRRNRTDISQINRSYHHLERRSNRSLEIASDIFFDATRRTMLTLMDVVLNRSPYADSCFNMYSTRLAPMFTQLNFLLQSCVQRESQRWTAITSVESSLLNLLKTNADELALNIQRCSTYTNFVTSGSDYNQAEACLKTNLEDMRDLIDYLEGQLGTVNRVVQQQVEASNYRFENCLFTKAHELAALLKSMRYSIVFCVGQYEPCHREYRDDDDHDFYQRRCHHHEDHGDDDDDDEEQDASYEEAEEHRRDEHERRCEPPAPPPPPTNGTVPSGNGTIPSGNGTAPSRYRPAADKVVLTLLPDYPRYEGPPEELLDFDRPLGLLKLTEDVKDFGDFVGEVIEKPSGEDDSCLLKKIKLMESQTSEGAEIVQTQKEQK